MLPTKALAMAIAAEWEWQAKGKPAMHTMPLMSIAVTATDQVGARNAMHFSGIEQR
jgi:ATP synthase mitochondrial F1 complex assembly factor 2